MIPHSRPTVSAAAVEAVVATLRCGTLSSGAGAAALEARWQTRYGVAAAAVSSGTAALYTALLALGVHRGDEVLIPSFICNSLAAAVRMLGAVPVPVDARPGGVNPDAAAARQCCTARTRALILPHAFGFAVDPVAFRRLGVPIVEDCAHAAGGVTTDGRPLGTLGDAAVFSFFATKLMPAGEGGCVASANAALVDQVRRLRDADRPDAPPEAFNFKLSDLHAALAAAQLDELSAQLARREAIACRYDQAFGARSFRRRIASVEHQAVVFRYLLDLDGNVEAFLAAAEAAGIACRRPVQTPLHRQLGGACPCADDLQRRLVSVPCYPALTDMEVETVCAELSTILARP